MVTNNVLDTSIVKDLSNHIYEKRKATAFQIETITKQALSRDDSRTIFRVIEELTELCYNGPGSAKMGAITALGSVSVALGPFAIAYFLKDIVTPIFATFRNTDARVRYYASESLYNIAKIARGEILLYFNEVFDILCILVTDTESSVKNAADILDRLIKDIVSEKATNYVSILQQEDLTSEIQSHLVDANGDAIQINVAQDPHKAFSLPKFIPTLLERMSVIDPFAKQFLLGWLELFDDIPSMELITFMPNLLGPLIKFLMNDCPADVRAKAIGILDIFLNEIASIYEVKLHTRKEALLRESAHTQIQGVAVPPQIPRPSAERVASGKSRQLLRSGAIVTSGSTLDAPQDLDFDNLSIKSNSTTIIKRGDVSSEAPNTRQGENDSEVGQENDFYVDGQNIFIDFGKIMDILLSFLRPPQKSSSSLPAVVDAYDLTKQPHEIYLEVKHVVLKWLSRLLDINPLAFDKFLPECISLAVENASKADQDKDYELRTELLQLNLGLQNLVGKLILCLPGRVGELGQVKSLEFEVLGFTDEVYEDFVETQLPKILKRTMSEYAAYSHELSRITLLDWLIFLYSKDTENVLRLAQEKDCDIDLSELVNSCAEASNEVILKVLKLFSVLSETSQEFFHSFIVHLVLLLQRDYSDERASTNSITAQSQLPVLLREKIDFTVRKLCVTLSSERIYRAMSEVLSTIDDCEFVSRMVVMLNNILLTATEVAGLRKRLRDLDLGKVEDYNLLGTLFPCWSNNVPSAISLCILTCSYELAYMIIKKISEQDVTFEFLTQIDILIQLLESPIFVKMRLQLLEPERNPFLCKTLYGLLMILPQSTTFNTLKNRLWLVSMLFPLPAVPGISQVGPSLAAPLAGSMSTPVVGATSTVLSTKRKRTLEMAEKFSKQQERHLEQISRREID